MILLLLSSSRAAFASPASSVPRGPSKKNRRYQSDVPVNPLRILQKRQEDSGRDGPVPSPLPEGVGLPWLLQGPLAASPGRVVDFHVRPQYLRAFLLSGSHSEHSPPVA